MTYWRLWNKSGLPVCIAISAAGAVQYRTDDLPSGGYTEWDVTSAWPWHDLQVFHRDHADGVPLFLKDRPDHVLAVFPKTGEPSTPDEVNASPRALRGCRRIPSVEHKGVLTPGDCLIDGDDPGIYAVTVKGLYGPDGYDIEVGGGHYFATLLGHVATYRAPTLKLHHVVSFLLTYTNNANKKTYAALPGG